MRVLTPLARVTLIVSWTLSGIALICVLTSLWISLTRGLHDFFSLASFIVGAMLVAQMTWSIIDEGEGARQRDMSTHQIAILAKSLLVSEALWTLTTTLLRVSALFIFQRLFYPTSRSMSVIALVFVCAIHGIVSVLELFLICRPLAAQWDPNVKGACGNQIISFMIIECFGLFLDCCILVVPTQAIWRMRTSFKSKIRMCLIFNIGIVVLAVTIVGLKLLCLKSSPDFIYSQSCFVMLSAIGCMLGVIFSSLLGFPRLFKHAFRRLKATQIRTMFFIKSGQRTLIPRSWQKSTASRQEAYPVPNQYQKPRLETFTSFQDDQQLIDEMKEEPSIARKSQEYLQEPPSLGAICEDNGKRPLTQVEEEELAIQQGTFFPRPVPLTGIPGPLLGHYAI